MSPDVLRVTLIVAFLIQSAAIVVVVGLVALIAVYFRRLTVYWRNYLHAVAEHSALTDRTARGLTAEIQRTVRDAQSDTVMEVAELMVESGMLPSPPPPPGTPAHPAPVVKLDPPANPTNPAIPGLAFALALILSAAAVAVPYTAPEVKAMDGDKAFKEGNYAGARAAYRSEGKRHDAAEAAIADGRLDDAIRDLDGCDDGRADYLRGIVAQHRGDVTAAVSLFTLAKEKGYEHAPAKLAELGEG